MENFCFIKNDKLYIIPYFFNKKFNYNDLETRIILLTTKLIKNSGLVHIVVDFKSSKLKKLDLKFCKKLIIIMQQKFPDKLSVCEIDNVPTFFKMVYQIIKNILDKKTRDKIVINS